MTDSIRLQAGHITAAALEHLDARTRHDLAIRLQVLSERDYNDRLIAAARETFKDQSEVVAVVFHTSQYDNGWFFSHRDAELLLETGVWHHPDDDLQDTPIGQVLDEGGNGKKDSRAGLGVHLWHDDKGTVIVDDDVTTVVALLQQISHDDNDNCAKYAREDAPDLHTGDIFCDDGGRWIVDAAIRVGNEVHVAYSAMD